VEICWLKNYWQAAGCATLMVMLISWWCVLDSRCH